MDDVGRGSPVAAGESDRDIAGPQHIQRDRRGLVGSLPIGHLLSVNRQPGIGIVRSQAQGQRVPARIVADRCSTLDGVVEGVRMEVRIGTHRGLRPYVEKAEPAG